MREIIFRGKRVDNGEWVQGHYYGMWDKKYILWGEHNHIPEGQEVIPETVGQYTGLKDKNGTMIFDGDVLFGWKGYSIAYAGDNDESLEMIAGWYIQRDNFETYTELVCSDEYEVIGTIHDQKEDV